MNKRRLTRELREQIAAEHASRHGGVYNPAAFLAEVKAAGPSHPAYEWFDWDRVEAAKKWQIHQARQFVGGTRITYEIVETRPAREVKVTSYPVPAFISPMGGRNDGGGYLYQGLGQFDMDEHCRQAAIALRSWLLRYESACAHVGINTPTIERYIKVLEGAGEQDDAA